MMTRYLTLIICLLTAFGCMASSLEPLKDRRGRNVRYGGKLSGEPVMIPRFYRETGREMRGVWMATVENLDMGIHRSADSFKKEFCAKLDRLAALKFNTLIFQVRPANDAFYPSKLNPWSRNLAGREGYGIPGFDPLRFMIDQCHARGIAFHAWLNPYRVVGKTKLSKAQYLKTLSPQNFARRYPHLVLSVPLSDGHNLLFLNPGEPQVRRHIAATVEEIALNYKVDGIHFDDYFYPYDGCGNADYQTFRRYGRGQELARWRRSNVNSLIAMVHSTVSRCAGVTGRRIPFGISPFGIWGNAKNISGGSLTLGKQSYFNQFADTRGWVRAGLIDYIVPQIYWQFGHDTAPYAALADWWAKQVRGTRCRLYMGMSPYRMGGRGWEDPMEIANQLRYNTKLPEIKGQVFFRASNVLNPSNNTMRNGLNYVWRNFWKHRVPSF